MVASYINAFALHPRNACEDLSLYFLCLKLVSNFTCDCGYRLWPLSVLPIGYRFLPSDEDLVSYSLRRKIDGHPSPPFILEFNVFGTELWNFPGDVEEERCFFCWIKNGAMSGDSSAVHKTVVGASGYWKLTGTEKQIITLPLNGIKSRFLFCEVGGGEDQEEEEEDDDEEEKDGGGGGSTNAAQTQPKWIIHEFRPQYPENQTERDQWAAYRVFQKKPKIPRGSVIYLRSSLQDHLNHRLTRSYSRSSS